LKSDASVLDKNYFLRKSITLFVSVRAIWCSSPRGHFFIPKRRADAEYCEREFKESGKKCSEVGAMHQYEKRVAENPILDAHKKAYRRFNSRTRTKKMTQAEFLQWSEQASQKRDECLAGDLPLDEYIAWLEQGRIRRSKNSPVENREDMTE
jgi:hypothetical protein